MYTPRISQVGSLTKCNLSLVMAYVCGDLMFSFCYAFMYTYCTYNIHASYGMNFVQN